MLGTLQGSFIDEGIFAYGISTTILGRAVFGTPGGYQSDIYAADTSNANSLHRVTSTAAINEKPI